MAEEVEKNFVIFENQDLSWDLWGDTEYEEQNGHDKPCGIVGMGVGVVGWHLNALLSL